MKNKGRKSNIKCILILCFAFNFISCNCNSKDDYSVDKNDFKSDTQVRDIENRYDGIKNQNESLTQINNQSNRGNFIDINYSIISHKVYMNTKKHFVIRLPEKVSESELSKIAFELRKREDAKKYSRIYIFHYLPGEDPKSRPWATTHFNPNLRVRILGLTKEQENVIINRKLDYLGSEIGSWLSESCQCKIVIFKLNNKIYKEDVYSERSFRKELIEIESTGSRKFERREGSDCGEYYMIDEKGNLQIHDEDGLITICKKL